MPGMKLCGRMRIKWFAYIRTGVMVISIRQKNKIRWPTQKGKSTTTEENFSAAERECTATTFTESKTREMECQRKRECEHRECSSERVRRPNTHTPTDSNTENKNRETKKAATPMRLQNNYTITFSITSCVRTLGPAERWPNLMVIWMAYRTVKHHHHRDPTERLNKFLI